MQFKLSVVFIFRVAAVQPRPGENRGTYDLLRAILQFNTKSLHAKRDRHGPGDLNDLVTLAVRQASGRPQSS
jgi:hypothetical protein